jgi:hypothetical protein
MKPFRSWLLIILFIFCISALNSLWLLIIRIQSLLSNPYLPGVWISSIIFFAYLILILYAIYLIISRKKKAVKISIYAMAVGIASSLWYDVLGRAIFLESPDKPDLMIIGAASFILNLVISIAIINYFQKSVNHKFILVR